MNTLEPIVINTSEISLTMSCEDIYEALRFCAIEKKCTRCPLFSITDCDAVLMPAVFEMIKRQKSEIEGLNHIRAELSKEIDKLREVNNDLNYQVNAWNPTQTIKDFAAYLCDGRVSNDPVVIAVKCAVKEITEDQE